MKLWRVDADFANADGDVAGAVSFFTTFPDPTATLMWSRLDGWNRDFYLEDAGAFTREEISLLICRPWPTLPSEQLLALARGLERGQATGVRGQESDREEEPVELADGVPTSPAMAAGTPAMQDAKRQLESALHHRGKSNARLTWKGK